MERELEERQCNCYHDAQPPELERHPRGKLEEEGRAVVPPRHCLAAPSAWPAPTRMPTLRKAHSSPLSLPPPSPPPHQRHLKNAIQTMPQHAHCCYPTLPLPGRSNPQNVAARPPPPPSSIPVANGVAMLPPQNARARPPLPFLLAAANPKAP